MKKNFLFLSMLSIAAFSCKEDVEDPAYNFKEQNLTGKIDNTDWAYQTGYASQDGSNSEGTIYITLVQGHTGEGCSTWPEGDHVFFTLPNATGLYKLKFDFNNWDAEDNQIVTLFDQESTTNNFATEGAVEITEITSTQISGRIDARSEDDTFVNGNFTVTICN
ncbi:hypothetical protein [Ohtaekwangia koreensis]|uniref:Uncharacterized protein n=1 Tax=Ohtaekwangia koreensis TaxID=688867 RepID=A0A1T5JVH4_9BACT|nr:hypothetical protein [Ohtaekwangia koreensis]SKC55365.1 hypothetical protein SAMN05660236_1530 [Ohtaekwangia koreensis]